MAWSQTDVDNLKTAIAAGVLRVRHGDEDVTYRSLAEMKEALRMMLAEVAGGARTRQVRFQTDKGLC